MENLKRRSRKARRELLGASIFFFTISLAMSACVVLDLRFGVSQRLAVKTHIEIGVLSDFVFLVVAPIFLAAVISQSFVLHRILKRFAASKAGGRTFQAPSGAAAPVMSKREESEEHDMMVTVC